MTMMMFLCDDSIVFCTLRNCSFSLFFLIDGLSCTFLLLSKRFIGKEKQKKGMRGKKIYSQEPNNKKKLCLALHFYIIF